MAELIDAYLDEVQAGLVSLDKNLERLEKNPTEEQTWQQVESFFETVRAGAPFVSFPRAYKLSVVALGEIADYKSGKRHIDVLPQVLMKLQRLKKIFASGVALKREPRDSDDDLLPKIAPKPMKVASESSAAAMLQTAQVLAQKERKILAQEQDLDDREEQLVQWAQSLHEQEADLKKRENFIFEDEKKNVTAHTQIADTISDIQKREAKIEEKIQFLQTQEKSIRDAQKFWETQGQSVKELKYQLNTLRSQKEEKDRLIEDKERQIIEFEEELASMRVIMERAQNQLRDRERQQEESRSLLENKNKALREMTETICRLEEELFNKNENSSKTEAELRLEIQQTKQQMRDAENALQTIQLQYARTEEAACKSGNEYAVLRAEYDEVLEHFTETQTSSSQLLREKSKLEQQCSDLVKQITVLQDELFAKSEQLKQTKNILEVHKRATEKLQSELQAAGWPLNVEKVQENFASILMNGKEAKSGSSVLFMRDLIKKMRQKPMVELVSFLKGFAGSRAKKYGKVYSLSCDIPTLDIDIEAYNALEKIFAALTDNSLRYAMLSPENKAIDINISAVADGSFIKIVFSDNSAVFPYEKIRGAIVEARLMTAEQAAGLNQEQVLRYLFHARVMRQQKNRGLVDIARVLEKAGGQIKAWFEEGFNVAFSLPRDFLFDKVLVFSVSDCRYAVPLNMVSETFALKASEIKENSGNKSYNWKGQSLSVLSLPDTEINEYGYGIVLQAGAYCFLMPVQRIADAEQFISFLSQDNDEKTPYLKACSTLESNAITQWVDVSFLLNLCPINMTDNVVQITAPKAEATRPVSLTTAYLIYHSDAHTIGAVAVDSVQKIEAFEGVQIDGETGSPVFISDGKKLPLQDSCSKKNFPFAQTVLIFETFAMTVADVADIIDAPIEQSEDVMYQGKKVPVFKI